MAPSISSDQLGHCAWFGICESLREGKEMEGRKEGKKWGMAGSGREGEREGMKDEKESINEVTRKAGSAL